MTQQQAKNGIRLQKTSWNALINEMVILETTVAIDPV